MARYGKSSISFFQDIFVSINKIFILAERLGNNTSHKTQGTSPQSEVVRQLVRQLEDSMLFTNNYTSFHLW